MARLSFVELRPLDRGRYGPALRDRSIQKVVRHVDLVLAARDRPRQTASGGAVVQARDRLGRRPLAWLGSGARRRRAGLRDTVPLNPAWWSGPRIIRPDPK